MKPSILGCLVRSHKKTSWKNHGHRRKSASSKGGGGRRMKANQFNHLPCVPHGNLPLDTRPIRRKICPLSVLTVNSNSSSARTTVPV